MLIEIVSETNDKMYVGEKYEWRLGKEGMEGFSSFEADVYSTDDYAKDGVIVNHIRLGDKTRTMKIVNVDWRNSDKARKTAQRFFVYKRKYKIYITIGDVQRWCEGYLTRMSMNEPTNEDYMLSVTMSFEFESPYLMSVDNFGKDIASVVPRFGFPYISEVGKGFYVAVFNFDRSVILNNNGDNIAYPFINVSFIGTVVNPKIIVNNAYIRVIGEFNSNDNITIDYNQNPPRIENNGVNILGICDKNSNFDGMLLQVGANEIKYDADNGTDEMHVSVFYYQLYTGI